MDNNPLRQYFRRPAVYFSLPSGGKGYEPGMLDIPESGEIPVFPMTAIDEITIRTPDALFNGSAVVELVKSCVPAIKDPWKLNSSDLDAVLIAIRAAGGQNQLEIETQCPKCENQATYGLNLVAILSQLKQGDYDSLLPVNDLKIKFRPLTYKEMNEAAIEQFKIQKAFGNIDSIENEDERNRMTQDAIRAVTEATMGIIAATIEFVETPTVRVEQKEYIHDFLRNCDGSVYLAIRDHNAKLKNSTELKPLDIKCDSCGHEYAQPFTLNASDFFG
jgi:hypothetical protein